MHIEIDCKVSKKGEAELIRAAKFFGKTLLTKEEFDDVQVEIAVTKNLKGCKGFCEVLDDGRDPRLFRIEMKADIAGEMMSTLAHEMVHLKQYVKNELFDCSNGITTKWHGKLLNVKDSDYFDFPWEIEAYGKEVGLIHKYYRKYKKLLVNKKSIFPVK
jgi:hypothetical protein